MPHRCLACSRLYPDDAMEVLRGCSCGKAAFLFVRADAVDAAPGVTSPREGEYAVDIARLLRTDETSVADLPVTHGRVVEKDGAFEIDLRSALDDERKG